MSGQCNRSSLILKGRTAQGGRVAKPSATDGFTLVELLVVIGIIALLISILLPSLNAARRSAQSIKCQSNLRQVGIGWQMYANDFKGRLAPIQQAGVSNGSDWPARLNDGRYLKSGRTLESPSPYMCPSASNDLNTTPFTAPVSSLADAGYQSFRNGDFATDPKSVSLTNYMVNADVSTSTFWGAPVTEYFPFVWWNIAAPTSTNKFPSIYSIKQSSRIMMVADGDWVHGLTQSRFTWRHGSGVNANRRCNMVYLDGHVESLVSSAMPQPSDNMYDHNKQLTAYDGKWGFIMVIK